MNSTKQKQENCLFFFAALFFLGTIKIWLIQDDEITARLMPADQSWYINAAHYILNGEWLGPYDSLTLLRQPGYPLWIAAVNLANIPLRLGIEFLLIISAGFFVYALLEAGIPSLLNILIFVLIVFLPDSFHLNNEVLSDTFYGPIQLLAMGALILHFTNRTNRIGILFAVLFGLFFAILWNTRHENLLILATLGTYGLWLARDQVHRSENKRALLEMILIGIGIPLTIISVATILIQQKNKFYYGVAVSSELLAPGFVAANSSLSRIKQKLPLVFVPVPKEARKDAYRVSPAFRELKPFLEGKIGSGYIQWGCQGLGVCSDLAGGWFLMAFREAVAAADHHRNALEAERFYYSIAQQIDEACRAKEIDCYPIFSTRLSSYTNFHNLPNYQTFIKSFANNVGLLWNFRPIINNFDNSDHVPENLRKIYDRVGHRREALVKYEPIRVVGWAFDPEDPIQVVEFRDGDNITLASTTSSNLESRHDVQENFQKFSVKPIPLNTGFTFQFTPNSYDLLEPTLVLTKKSGKQLRLSPFPVSKITEGTYYSIDILEGFRIPPPWLIKFQLILPKIYNGLLKSFSLLFLLLLVLFFVFFKNYSSKENGVFIVFIMAVPLFFRLLVLTLLDITSFPISHYFRLLYAAKLLYIPFLAVAIFWIGRRLVSSFSPGFNFGRGFRRNLDSMKT